HLASSPLSGRTYMRPAFAVGLFLFALATAAQQPMPPAEPPLSADEQTVKAAHLPMTGAGLTEFFRKRSLRAAESGPIQAFIKQLGDKDADVRGKAFGGLVQYGMTAVPLLRQ